MRLAGISLFLLASVAAAEVREAAPDFMSIKLTRPVAAKVAKAWPALFKVSAWWDMAHSYSQDAKNLTLDAKAPGCLCEKLPGGGVRHLEVLAVVPERHLVRLGGGLGPLQQGAVAGTMTWSLEEHDGKTDVTRTYEVSGRLEGGLDKLAPAVDEVLRGQLDRFARFVETGRPAEK